LGERESVNFELGMWPTTNGENSFVKSNVCNLYKTQDINFAQIFHTACQRWQLKSKVLKQKRMRSCPADKNAQHNKNKLIPRSITIKDYMRTQGI
jgi:hypothetical protein